MNCCRWLCPRFAALENHEELVNSPGLNREQSIENMRLLSFKQLAQRRRALRSKQLYPEDGLCVIYDSTSMHSVPYSLLWN
ncbi:eukaryotic translation initiation factor 3 subunit M-like [Uranotaenia lowii]|uniref:eukaryotic translation initiation factor 3 subunit M-like n=1 Tax=Uranotaenia lowii TaxID=190385 RepID=UPI0024786DE5|nr:eukaryotic translation initiation factor 3 subunit M-like [Uranotaenia lowii]